MKVAIPSSSILRSLTFAIIAAVEADRLSLPTVLRSSRLGGRHRKLVREQTTRMFSRGFELLHRPSVLSKPR